MSDVSEHSEFDYPKKKKKKKKKKEKRGGHIINCLLTDSVMALGPYAMTSIYFPVRPSHSVNKYIVLLLYLFHGNILQSKPSFLNIHFSVIINVFVIFKQCKCIK